MPRIEMNSKMIKFIADNDKFFEGRISSDFIDDMDFSLDWIDKSDYYEEDDITLVRTTGVLPEKDGTIKTVANSEDYAPIMDYFYGRNNDVEKPLCSTYRSTIHFTLNGLVGNHMGGNFSGRNFIILDSFEEHKSDDIGSFHECDTFFSGDVRLSKDAVICMPEETYQELLKNPESREFLESHKVFTYNLEECERLFEGDDNKTNDIENAVCKYALIALGKPCFSTNGSYYTVSSSVKATRKMVDFLKEYTKENDLPVTQHSGSKFDKEDIQKYYDSAKNSMVDHFKYIVLNSNVSEEERERMMRYFPYLEDYAFDITNPPEYLTCHSKEIEKILDEYPEEVFMRLDRDKRKEVQDKIMELERKDIIRIEEFKKDIEHFKELIGVDQYNALTKKYNEEYKEKRRKELSDKAKNTGLNDMFNDEEIIYNQDTKVL